jgi:DNA-binding transcriptional ArsR family regulator
MPIWEYTRIVATWSTVFFPIRRTIEEVAVAGSVNSMNDTTLNLVAERFRLLGDAVRLRLLQTLADREMSVAELVDAVGAAQANVSKHLQLLSRDGLVARRKEGLKVFYRVADPRVFQLCDVVCGSLTERLSRELSALGSISEIGGKSARKKGGKGSKMRS